MDRILALVFPPRCAFCGQIMPVSFEGNICSDCREHLPLIPAEKQALYGDFYTLCLSSFFYKEPLIDSIHRYKFQGRSWYSRVYGPYLRATLQEQFPDGFDLVTWAPLSVLRHLKRGYDQAELLAVEAGKLYSIKPQRLLRKTHHTKAQSKLSPAARRKNAENLYRAVPGVSLDGKRILLVDDVVTTGSTLSDCTRALVAAGAGEVVCLTLARSVSARRI